MSEKNEENNIEEEDDVSKMFSDVLSTLTGFRSQITGIQMGIKTLEKVVKKEMKTLRKETTKYKQKGSRKPSGFAKPTKISKELCEFMGKEAGTELARTEVTQYVIQYITDHRLQNPKNRKAIIPDDPLKELLGVTEKDEVTYFNIQKYMNRHFGDYIKNNDTNKVIGNGK